MKLKPRYIVLIAILLVILDQATKFLVKTNMTLGEEIPLLGSWCNLLFIENVGAAFGMEVFNKLFLSLFRIVAVSALIWYIVKLWKKQAPTGVIIAFTAVMVGALGNIIDSAFYGLIFTESTHYHAAALVPWGEGYGTFLHGKVVDMLYFPIIDIAQMPDWIPFYGGERFIFFSPIFNLADSYISVAVIYLLIFQRKFFK